MSSKECIELSSLFLLLQNILDAGDVKKGKRPSSSRQLPRPPQVPTYIIPDLYSTVATAAEPKEKLRFHVISGLVRCSLGD